MDAATEDSTAFMCALIAEPEHLALCMVGALFAFLLCGYPVAFTLGGVGLLFGLIGYHCDFFNIILLNALPQRIEGVMMNITLLAVPLFIFMGVTLERSGIAEDLLDSMSLLFGRLRAGMPFSVIISGALLAASTGIVGASVVTMGLMSLPVMLKRGFRPDFSSGVICASGTLGQIIPPSIVLILLGDIMGVSVGELFLGAVVPGLILVAGYLGYSFLYCNFHADAGGTSDHETTSGLALAIRVSKALLPPGVLIVSVLGSIFFGIASPTEAAAVGAFGALVLAVGNGKLDLKTLRGIMDSTTYLTCMVFMILLGATTFSLVFRGLGGDDVIRDLVVSLPHAKYIFLAIVMLLLFVLGCFLDFIEIVFIVVPILVPLIEEFQFNPLWFSVLIAVNLQTSFLTPPLGFSLFYLRGVAPPEVTSRHIYKGIIPFVIIQLAALALLVAFPGLVTWLPSIVSS